MSCSSDSTSAYLKLVTLLFFRPVPSMGLKHTQTPESSLVVPKVSLIGVSLCFIRLSSSCFDVLLALPP